MAASFQQQVQSSFNKAAQTYDEHADLQRIVARELFARAKPKMNDASRWLDIGCGTGFLQELIRTSQLKTHLIQLDIAPAMCEVAQHYASDEAFGLTHTLNADMAALPVKSQSFNGVISSLAMQWSGDMECVFAEVQRVLQQGGCFYASIMGEGSLAELKSSYHALGREAPIQSFISDAELTAKLQPFFGKDVAVSCKPITLYYDNVMQLLRRLRGIGASFKGERQQLASKGFFAELEAYYSQKFGDEQGVPATWNILSIEGIKP